MSNFIVAHHTDRFTVEHTTNTADTLLETIRWLEVSFNATLVDVWAIEAHCTTVYTEEQAVVKQALIDPVYRSSFYVDGTQMELSDTSIFYLTFDYN